MAGTAACLRRLLFSWPAMPATPLANWFLRCSCPLSGLLESCWFSLDGHIHGSCAADHIWQWEQVQMARGWARQTQCVCVCVGGGGFRAPAILKSYYTPYLGPSQRTLSGNVQLLRSASSILGVTLRGRESPNQGSRSCTRVLGGAQAMHCIVQQQPRLSLQLGYGTPVTGWNTGKTCSYVMGTGGELGV